MGDVMYSKNNILLPSKSAYTLKEACNELNLYFNRTDIDEKYILDLVHQGHIWFYAKFSRENAILTLPMEWELDGKFDCEEEKTIEEVIFFNKILRHQTNYNAFGDYDLYLKLSIIDAFYALNTNRIINPVVIDIYDPYDDFYWLGSNLSAESIHNLEFYKIPENFNRDDFFRIVLINFENRICIKKIIWFDVHDEIYRGTDRENSYIETPEIHEIVELHNQEVDRKIKQFILKKGWTPYYWYGDKDMESLKLDFSLEDILILKEDMEVLKKGESRRIREQPGYTLHLDKKESNTLPPETIHASKNGVSSRSINKIIYALADMANLDISQPQAAFSQLQMYCEKNGFELPNKDTCGKAFKNAKYHFDNFSSK